MDMHAGLIAVNIERRWAGGLEGRADGYWGREEAFRRGCSFAFPS